MQPLTKISLASLHIPLQTLADTRTLRFRFTVTSQCVMGRLGSLHCDVTVRDGQTSPHRPNRYCSDKLSLTQHLLRFNAGLPGCKRVTHIHCIGAPSLVWKEGVWSATAHGAQAAQYTESQGSLSRTQVREFEARCTETRPPHSVSGIAERVLC